LRVVTQCPSHCHSTFVRCVIIIQLLSNFHSMFVGLPSNFRPHSVRHPSLFCPTFVTILSNICHHSVQCPSLFHLTSVHKRPSINIRSSSFIPVDTLYSSNYMYYVHMYPISYSSNRI
jgi:hypothetical protein